MESVYCDTFVRTFIDFQIMGECRSELHLIKSGICQKSCNARVLGRGLVGCGESHIRAFVIVI